MIQLNLLPDVKLEYIKAQRTHRLVISVSVIVVAASVLLLVLMLGYDGLQKKKLSDLKSNINSETSQLQGKPNINEILTVQNQLQSLTNLHAQKPAVSQLFTYLNEVTPATVSINNLDIDFTQDTATITGGADALSSINAYADTLKATTYTSSTNSSSSPAFNNVVLSSFGVSQSTGTSGSTPSNQAVTYSITLGFDKNIFDITQTIKLNVPTQVVTRANVAQPTDLFEAAVGGSH